MEDRTNGSVKVDVEEPTDFPSSSTSYRARSVKKEPQTEDPYSELSESSSSGEDSDDDYEAQILQQMKSYCSDSDDDRILEVAEISHGLEKKTTKKRIGLLKRKLKEEKQEQRGDVVLDFESKTVHQRRQRKLFRRRMTKTPGLPKRRKMKRGETVCTDEFRCDTFLGTGIHVSSLTKELDPEDPEVDHAMLAVVFRELDGEDAFEQDVEEGEDEIALIAQDFGFYQSRNIKERIDQTVNVDVHPMAEKLASYNCYKSSHGSRRSSIRAYHPDLFTHRNLHRLPEPLIWKRKFKHILYQKTVFDPNKDTTHFLQEVGVNKKVMIEKFMCDEFLQRAQNKREMCPERFHIDRQNPIRDFETFGKTEIDEQLYLDVSM